MRTRMIHGSIVLLMAGLLTGCAARVIDDSQLQYLAPEFTVESLSDHGLSLLPVVAGQGQEGLRRPLAAKLEAHLSSHLPEGRFLGAIETLDLLNEANLTEAYAQMIDDYSRAAILNKKTLHRIGQATGIRYLLHVKLLDQSRTERIQQAFLSDNLVSLEGKNVSIFGQVWDCGLGDVVWEGTGQVNAEAEVEFQYVKQDIDQLVTMAAQSFLNNLPGIKLPPTN
ncbi:MAG: hypothetical protein OXN17_09185 [Candidatus Poribacteria bacterium]|nr:hypothetical protein [Candidatus Poribacteria bacterium]MDE0506251.1 hypothetical protein [Candidatus Poribacteria bacterium]